MKPRPWVVVSLAAIFAVVCLAGVARVDAAAGAIPMGYWVDVDQSGTTTSANLGGSGSLAATGQGNVNYGYAQECAPTQDGGPFSIGQYPPATCAQLGRPYNPSGSPEQPSGFWFTGNQYCANAGRLFSGANFTWHVQLPQAGPWHVEVYVPSWTSYGWGDQYILTSADGQFQNTGFTQQAYHGQWVNLFESHQFAANRDYTVELTLADGADSYCHYQVADQMRWVYDGPSITAPVNTTPPTIIGLAEQGQTLTAFDGSWTNNPTSHSYQWEDCDSSGGHCSPIVGATSQSYTLLASDVGHTLVVRQTATNAGGSSSPANSAPTAVVTVSGWSIGGLGGTNGGSSGGLGGTNGGLGGPTATIPCGSRGTSRPSGQTDDFTGPRGEIALSSASIPPHATFYLLKFVSATIGNAITIQPFDLDNQATCIYLRLTAPGKRDVLLLGKVPPTSLLFLPKNSVALHLSIPLFSLTTSARAGSLRLTLVGLLHGGKKITLLPTAHLSLGSRVVPGMPTTGFARYPLITLTLSHRTTNHRLGTGTYRGFTNWGLSRKVVLKTAFEGTLVTEAGLMAPGFPCDRPIVEITPDPTLTTFHTSAPVDPSGAFSIVYSGDESYVSGEIGGYYLLKITGVFESSHFVSGTYQLTVYVAYGPALGSTCSNGGTFTAAILRP